MKIKIAIKTTQTKNLLGLFDQSEIFIDLLYKVLHQKFKSCTIYGSNSTDDTNMYPNTLNGKI